MGSGKRRKKTFGEWAVPASAERAMDALRDSRQCAPMLRLLRRALLKGGPEAEALGRSLVVEQGFLRLFSSALRQEGDKQRTAGWIEILGGLAMSSLDSHQMIVSDRDAMCAFAEIFKTIDDVELLTSASHVLVDLLVTSGGREAFKSSPVTHYLLRLLCQVSDGVSGGLEKGAASRIHLCKRNAGDSSSGASNAGDTSCKGNVFCQNERGKSTVIGVRMLRRSAFPDHCDDLMVAMLSAVKALLRDSRCGTSKDTIFETLQALAKLWHSDFFGNRLDSNVIDKEERKRSCSHESRHLVAACIVQMAMMLEGHDEKNLSPCQYLFETTDQEVGHFLDNYWEQTPQLVKNKLSLRLLDFFKPFKSLEWMAKKFLAGCLAVPPAFADDINPSDHFESIESTLGGPMIYGRDIRMVKTMAHGLAASMTDEKEIHFKRSSSVSDADSGWHVHPNDILQAVKQGYTIAIRGMERRCPEIAEAASWLSRQVGQPSVGANMYLTPINEQGLDLHFDDHCVFVCQLVGSKAWTVYPPVKHVPRLYASRAFDRSALRQSAPIRYNVDEGDVLYMPRGSPHMARAWSREIFLKAEATSHAPGEVDEPAAKEATNGLSMVGKKAELTLCSSVPSFSLHLTFGVEVEPPFEWEGMVHIALRVWAEERWRKRSAERHISSLESSCQRLERACEWLLQIAINILGDRDQVFRKACLTSAAWLQPSCSLVNEIATVNQEASSLCGSDDSKGCNACDQPLLALYQKLVETVVKEANVLEALSLAGGAQNLAESCPESRMTWLRHISQCEGRGSGTAPKAISSLLSEPEFEELIEGHTKLEIEGAFLGMKLEFGTSRMFHQAKDIFTCLWSKYNASRIHLTRGLLTLHHACIQSSQWY